MRKHTVIYINVLQSIVQMVLNVSKFTICQLTLHNWQLLSFTRWHFFVKPIKSSALGPGNWQGHSPGRRFAYLWIVTLFHSIEDKPRVKFCTHPMTAIWLRSAIQNPELCGKKGGKITTFGHLQDAYFPPAGCSLSHSQSSKTKPREGR